MCTWSSPWFVLTFTIIVPRTTTKARCLISLVVISIFKNPVKSLKFNTIADVERNTVFFAEYSSTKHSLRIFLRVEVSLRVIFLVLN